MIAPSERASRGKYAGGVLEWTKYGKEKLAAVMCLLYNKIIQEMKFVVFEAQTFKV